jgi:glycosyltransferase involved in cell wall biosynthesis
LLGLMQQTVPAQISVVLGTYNRLPFLKATIASVRTSQIDIPYEIVVVDGGSSDGTIEWLTARQGAGAAGAIS